MGLLQLSWMKCAAVHDRCQRGFARTGFKVSRTCSALREVVNPVSSVRIALINDIYTAMTRRSLLSESLVSSVLSLGGRAVVVRTTTRNPPWPSFVVRLFGSPNEGHWLVAVVLAEEVVVSA